MTRPDDAQHGVLVLSCSDGPGIVHAVSGVLAQAGGNITESQQFSDPGTGRFLLRVCWTAAAPSSSAELPPKRQFSRDSPS